MFCMCMCFCLCYALVMKSIISNLHLKFAEKTWNETFQLVRRCMVRQIPVNIHAVFIIVLV